MSPVKTPASNLQGKSPSKVIQQGSDNSWGKQTGTESPQDAISKQYNKNPVTSPGSVKSGDGN